MQDSLFDLIFDIVRHIPRGRVTTYGAIARCIGTGGSARIVGWAMHAAGAYPRIPAHRVVNSKGLLTGKHHFGTLTLMQELLEKEGIEVRDNKVVDFARLFWDPATLVE